MRWQVGYTRNILIAASLALAATMAVHLIRHQLSTIIGFPVDTANTSSPFHTWVTLTFKEFHPAGNQFTGSVVIESAPRLEQLQPDEIKQAASSFSHVLLRFYRRDQRGTNFQGGSDAPITMAFPPAWGSLMGNGTFSWTATPQPGAFYYPFDRYLLTVNPALMEVSQRDVYYPKPIESMEAEFGNSNLIPRLHPLHTGPRDHLEDIYEISLERPVLLRLLAIIVGALLVIWLMYMIVAAKPEEYAGNIVTLFVGVFSIRSSLLAGAPIFPSLIDYCALGVYLSAVLIVIIKWLFPDKKTQVCRFCLSTIPRAAIVCPQCTQALTERA